MRENVLKWQWFRDFFSITIFRYFVSWFALVPVFAKLSEHLPKEIYIQLSKNNSYMLNLSLPFKWEILWISSLSFVLAFILYLIFVPTFVKRYFSLKDYLEYGHSPRWIVWESQILIKSKFVDVNKFVTRITTKNYASKVASIENFQNLKVAVDEKQTYLLFEHQNEKYKFGMPIIAGGKESKELTDIAVRELFWEVFARYSASKFGIRLTIQILLMISLVTFAYPFCESIYSGFQYLMK
jgi:energy-coupling factor transporter transmembrane protein EcfT